MATREEVEKFLNSFHTKLQIFEIRFISRRKNAQALLDLEITPVFRESVIKNIDAEDYSEGPLIVDTLDKLGDMWVFGKDVKGHEVYIKISLGQQDDKTICISFHKAEHPMTYPLKEKTL
jgi:hypothetical protein